MPTELSYSKAFGRLQEIQTRLESNQSEVDELMEYSV
jgi:hypothetical protein